MATYDEMFAPKPPVREEGITAGEHVSTTEPWLQYKAMYDPVYAYLDTIDWAKVNAMDPYGKYQFVQSISPHVQQYTTPYQEAMEAARSSQQEPPGGWESLMTPDQRYLASLPGSISLDNPAPEPDWLRDMQSAYHQNIMNQWGQNQPNFAADLEKYSPGINDAFLSQQKHLANKDWWKANMGYFAPLVPLLAAGGAAAFAPEAAAAGAGGAGVAGATEMPLIAGTTLGGAAFPGIAGGTAIPAQVGGMSLTGGLTGLGTGISLTGLGAEAANVLPSGFSLSSLGGGADIGELIAQGGLGAGTQPGTNWFDVVTKVGKGLLGGGGQQPTGGQQGAGGGYGSGGGYGVPSGASGGGMGADWMMNLQEQMDKGAASLKDFMKVKSMW